MARNAIFLQFLPGKWAPVGWATFVQTHGNYSILYSSKPAKNIPVSGWPFKRLSLCTVFSAFALLYIFRLPSYRALGINPPKLSVAVTKIQNGGYHKNKSQQTCTVSNLFISCVSKPGARGWREWSHERVPKVRSY